jgi:hypothetical protein
MEMTDVLYNASVYKDDKEQCYWGFAQQRCYITKQASGMPVV